eukprot:scaffold113035_cov35-Tisochrysis_lutea.AAC.7
MILALIQEEGRGRGTCGGQLIRWFSFNGTRPHCHCSMSRPRPRRATRGVSRLAGTWMGAAPAGGRVSVAASSMS